MKKINLLKTGLVALGLGVVLMSSNSAIAEGIKGSGDSTSGGTAQLCESCSVWMDIGNEWGYRVAVYDETDGSYLGRSNILKWNYGGDFYMAAGDRMRKEFIANHGDYNNLTSSADASYVTSSSFISKLVNFTVSGTSSNFTDVLKSTLNLSGSGGSYVMIDPETESKASDGVMVSTFNNFFAQVGLPNIGQSVVDKANASHVIYLEVEPMMAWTIRDKVNAEAAALKGKRLVLTATESAYYILEHINNSGQLSMVLSKLANAQFINSNEFAAGDGFYGLASYPSGFSCLAGNPKYISNCNELLGWLKSGHNGTSYAGSGVGVWRLSEIVTGECIGKCCPGGECDDPPGPPDYGGGCSPKYKIDANFKNSCETDGSIGSGYIKDKISWSCIFESDSEDKQPEVQIHYKTAVSNPYCTIYCKEEIQTSFPSYGAYAALGTYLRVTSGLSSYQSIGPVTITGTVTCRTSSENNAGHIDFEKFKTDYAAADAAVVTAWNTLQEQVAYKTAKAGLSTTSASVSTETCSAGAKRYYHYDCVYGKNGSVSCNRFPDTYGEDVLTTPDTCNKAPNCHYTTREPAPSGPDVTHKKTKKTSTWKYYGGTVTVTETSYDCGVHSGSVDYDDKKYTEALTAYNNAVTKRTSIYNQLKDCNNFLYDYSELNPQLTISYSDSIYGTSEYPLTVSGSYVPYSNVAYFATGSSLNESSSGGSTTSSTTKIAIHSCPLTAKISDMFNTQCGDETLTNVDVPNNNWIESTVTKSLSYKLDDNLYNYVVKESGESINYSPTSNIRNYTYLPFGNLPVHFSSAVNVDLAYTIHLKSFGEEDKFTKYVFGGKSFNNKYVSNATDYQCWYKAIEDLYLPHGDDIIYRTISLRDPFPGENGTTRAPGYNWRGDELNNNYPDIYIHNNRGVNEYDVYRLDPMYEIELTPALMREIQDYNKERNRIESYYYGKTRVLGYSDFTLNCKKDGNYKNKECTSNILREWFVKGCAIKGADLSGYSNCGNRTVAW